MLLLVFPFRSMLWFYIFTIVTRNDIFYWQEMVSASVVCVNATLTTLAVPVTVLWTLPPARLWMGKSAMAGASVSVAPVSVQIPSSKGRPVRCARRALESVPSISEYFRIAWNGWELAVCWPLYQHTIQRTALTSGYAVNKLSHWSPVFKS